MERRAMNPSGRLGSLYDARRDHIIVQSCVNFDKRTDEVSSPTKCALINGDQMTCYDVLRRIGLDDELLLSLLLNTSERTGLAKVLRHPFEINQYTRIVYYSWLHRVEQRSGRKGKLSMIRNLINSRTTATHVITAVSLGIDALLVLQLPSDTHTIQMIDRTLEELKRELMKGQRNAVSLSTHQKTILDNILSLKVYSNIAAVDDKANIAAVLREMDSVKRELKRCCPLTYTLQPISSFSDLFTGSLVIFKSLPNQLIVRLEQHLLALRNPIIELETSLNGETSRLLCGHLAKHLTKAQERWSHVEKRYVSWIKQFKKLVIDARQAQAVTSSVPKISDDPEQMQLKRDIHALLQFRDHLQVKGRLINDLRQQQFDYQNVDDDKLKNSDSLRDIGRRLTKKEKHHCTLCSDDTLNAQDPQKLTKWRRLLLERHKATPNLRLIYLDFSYSKSPLREMIILPLNSVNLAQKDAEPRTIPPSDDFKSTPVSTVPSLPKEEEAINILLLGETGVGKSTFINAFANYLAFSSLQQALESEPIVLIPVSFILTSGHQFEEHTITFGECDPTNNEHFNEHGQSVTQQCRSYVFDLPHHQGRRVCLIDTPGFGDTRGVDQDDRNLEHVLRYITRRTHLHAVCFLLKPNESRLNIFFRSCFDQLFSLLGTKVAPNVMFCFTSARSTFYAPGNTAPLLKKMLTTVESGSVQLKKENSFCFDNEAFRYLMAIQNGVVFSEEERDDYERSWITSMKESNRLIDYIQTQLNVFRMTDQLQSVKHAQLTILDMIRPMLEAMRNQLRNIILCKIDQKSASIQLSPDALSSKVSRCRACQASDQSLEPFWIRIYQPHEITDECLSCPCPVDQHSPLDYVLEYRRGDTFASGDEQRMLSVLNELCRASAKFSYFLTRTVQSNREDPLSTGLMEMIDEETGLHQRHPSARFNDRLRHELTELKKRYQAQVDQLTSEQERIDLPTIYTTIKRISDYPMMRQQIDAVNKTQQRIIEQNERGAQPV